MRLTRLRLTGFKSFVEPTEFLIEPGLTGVVGPNGCGKSNLVEALRWVMGENAHRNLRAAEMDDVIFSGNATRPSRNAAEVVLTVENADRTAPAAFNDADLLEISRRIERERGSTYRINGREVRARDVQLIFADASTGARSPALVRQGQIAELIAARPQARRRILEEAAGISGLHSRRHEAELRLTAAEQNLDRLEDVLSQITVQLEGLKRQARQAVRYRTLSADIRRHEALIFHLDFQEAGRQVLEGEAALAACLRATHDASGRQAEMAREAAVAAHALPPLRAAEAAAAAETQRLAAAAQALATEERHAADRRQEIGRRLADGRRDIEREGAVVADAAAMLERLDAEETRLREAQSAAREGDKLSAVRLAVTQATLADSEKAFADLQAALAEQQAQRGQVERSLRDLDERIRRFDGQKADIEREREALAQRAGDPAAAEALRVELDQRRDAARQAEAAALAAEAAHATAREAEAAALRPLQEAEREAAGRDTEARTLARLVEKPGGARFAAVSERMRVQRGFEAALAAALGDDLDAALDEAAPTHWAGSADAGNDPPLPAGAQSLADLVEAPDVLLRRLRQIGLVEAADGPRLAQALRPGQRLVSRQGELWRWDGFRARADAPTPAARRLEQRGRLDEAQTMAEEARAALPPLKQAAEAATAARAGAAETERRLRDAWRAAIRAADQARDRLAAAERQIAQGAARRSALDEATSRLAASRDEAMAMRAGAEAAFAAMADGLALRARLDIQRADVAERRDEFAEAQAAAQALAREREMRSERLAAITTDRASWARRRKDGAAQAEALRARLAELEADLRALDEAPAAFAARRRAIAAETAAAEEARAAAARRLAAAEADLAAAEARAREALDGLGRARAAEARAEEKLDGLRSRRARLARDIEEALQVAPSGLPKLAGLKEGATADRTAAERGLEAARRERDRLGAVNLRAEDELHEVQARLDALTAERDDVVQAIRDLRQAILNLNREGRERLLGAFDAVNGHFQSLFQTLFGGGTAELQLTESDDPLDAGLELLARPPGKKPQTLSLLSGGEQALTAMALIFAVFLTNPAPICVLDEVDAPLDDANVERFCDLLDTMARDTRTRFVAITHNPITMARMNRLFGVTMAERGVSTLLSVDLGGADRLLQAAGL